MKLYKETIAYASNIVVVKEEHFAFNEFPFHYHPECELILILKGSGQRFVGDSIGEFNDGDLYFLGSHLPHTFYNKHLSANRDIHQVVIQFAPDFLGKGFFDLQPFKRIKTFFENAARGYRFTQHTLEQVSSKVIQLLQLDETEVIIRLLSILDTLSKSNEYEFVSSVGYSNKLNDKETERMSRVYDYVFHHFKEDITLNEIASVACLSPEAFCRYFKKHTRKTFSEFLVEVRIGNACRLLQENKMGISQVSLCCGFNNISYFNRKFKSLTQKTPVEYIKTFSRKTFPISQSEMFEPFTN